MSKALAGQQFKRGVESSSVLVTGSNGKKKSLAFRELRDLFISL
jgi:hypothetical protein